MFYRLPPRQHRTVITRIGGAQYAWELVYNISIVYQIIFWHCRCSAVIRGHNFDMCDIGTPIGHIHYRTSKASVHSAAKYYFFFASLRLNTTRSSSSILWAARVFWFGNIRPAYDNRIRDRGTGGLPKNCRMRSRRVETNRLSGISGTVTTCLSSFHSGFEGSLGS